MDNTFHIIKTSDLDLEIKLSKELSIPELMEKLLIISETYKISQTTE